MKKLIIALVCSILTIGLFAQKVGHLNTGILLEEMQEVKTADSELAALQKQMMSKGEQMVKDFQTQYQSVLAEVNAGQLTPKQQQEKQELLQKKQQEIQTYEQQVQTDMLKKREELLKPILDRVDQAIQEVGKENNLLFIFDTSVPNTILFSQESLDVTSKVKAKLGL